MRTFLFSWILILLLGSCTLEKHRYSSGYHVEWKKNHRKTNQYESANVRMEQTAGRTDDTAFTVTCKQDSSTSEIFQPLIRLHSTKSNVPKSIAPIIYTAFSPENPFSHPPIVPHDSFSWITLFIAFLLCFFIPPLGLLLAFGNGNAFKTDLKIFLLAILFAFVAFVMLFSYGLAVGPTPVVFIVLASISIALSVLATIYALVKLIKALRTKTTD